MQEYYTENNTAATDKTVVLDQLKDAALLALDFGYEFLKEAVQKPLEKGEEAIEKVGEKGKDAVDKGVETAKQHPVMTLLAAFGLGFIVVKLLKRK
ncbi:hypothetical protein [Desulfitobacterium sp.]|uniref:hypothetical protein n=1 Tax=Desulfitobacterium sp. TaxID=49981 RepID=UPI002B1EB530|nr:hypothetical protein [Desulfitobacterium sp.]MEA4900019.1 hypothetical protein [Desulfitobacterium sp.]